MAGLTFLLGLLVGAVAALVLLRVARARAAATRSAVKHIVIDVPGADLGNEPDELARLQTALDSIPIGVVYADASGKIVVRNQMAESAAGARHGDILVAEAIETHLRAAAGGEDRRQTLELFGPPAKVLSIHAEPVVGGGAVATISDITERARLDSVRTDFVANISHELKTPIGALSILAETLADADDPDVVARLSGKIVKEAERLTLTIEDLLELSRIELGGDAVRDNVLAGLVLTDAADRVRGLADRRQIRLVVAEPETALTVVGDRRQLVSALGNLIDNAVKYSDAGSDVEVFAAREGDNVVFSVADHGMGIASQHLDRIFERFYRVDRARSRDTGGVGLGLAIVRHVAANHGGEVKVTSQEGEGSTFMLVIPAAPDFVNEQSRSAAMAARG